MPRLDDLAKHAGAELAGDPDYVVCRAASLGRADRQSLSFFADRRRLAELKKCTAGAVFIGKAYCDQYSGNRLIVDDPYRSFVEALELLESPVRHKPGIHPSVIIASTASIGKNVDIGAYSVIDADVVIADGVSVGANVHLGEETSIGTGSHVNSNVTIYRRTVIGAECNIESGVVVGSPGFGYLETDDHWIPVPQAGRVVIGDHVDIGANTTIDRGTLDDTVIGNGVKLDNLIQVAHNVVIGEDTAVAACAGIAGSTRIGKRCKIGGRASIVGHIEIADDVVINATGMVTASIREAGTYSSNLAAQPVRRWRRTLARIMHLDELARRVRRLEKHLDLSR